jgi:hypothetical protein
MLFRGKLLKIAGPCLGSKSGLGSLSAALQVNCNACRLWGRRGLPGRFQRNLWAAVAAMTAASLFGCAGSNGTPHAGTISIMDPNGVIPGQLTSLPVGTAAAVTMTVNDLAANAGVDWTVLCNGNPLTGSLTGGACGTFSPAHTSNGGVSIYTAPGLTPQGTTVTLTAALTGNPAIASSATLPIVSLPISVAFASPPASAAAGASVGLQANALNDTTGAGVAFTVSCSSSPCGSFSNVQAFSATYTAPATVPSGGMNVVITATSKADTTKFADITVAITAGAAEGTILVNVSPPNLNVATQGAAHVAKFVATVLNDPAGKGVTWSVTCNYSNCGQAPGSSTSGAQAIYTANGTVPIGGVVTVTACSMSVTTACGNAMATEVATSPTPIVITMTKMPPATLGENAPATLTATANPAGQNIVWSAACGTSDGCGSFNPAQTSTGQSTIYTAPATVPQGSVVTITAASVSVTSPSNSAVADTTITTPAPAIAFVQQPPSSVVASTQGALSQVPVSASVTNDTSPGGVTWSVSSCGSAVPGGCGWIQPFSQDGATAMYTAPPVAPSGMVTINATSASSAFSPISISSSAITITPSTTLSVGFVPFAPAQLAGYAVVNLNASVSNDLTNGGVDWQVCGSGCGFFTTVPAIPEILATPTTPYIPPVPAVTSTNVLGWPSGLPITYTAPQATQSNQTVVLTAKAHSGAAATSATIAIVNVFTGPTLSGVVQAGTQPVVGSAVALYAAGTGGYGSASTLLYEPGGSAYATTDSNGRFSVLGGYTCPQSDSQVYLVATGGKVGSNGNPNVAMMTALGPCSNLGSGSVVINEVTTVGSAWPLAPFAANDALTGNSSYRNIGSSSTNTAGLADAFATVNNLVNISTGEPNFFVPSGNAAVPYVEINTLADILNSCTVTTGGAYGDGTACGNLFFGAPNVGKGGIYNGTVPTDTLQAAFNTAQHPGGGFGYFDNLPFAVSADSPFQPTLSAKASDWSISLNFSGVGGLTSSSSAMSFAIDSSNDLWIADKTGNRVIEWDSLGAPLSPSTGYAAGGIAVPGPIAVDASGNIWISQSNGLTELNNLGMPAYGSPFSGGANGLGMAFDSLTNLWITNGTGVTEFTTYGVELSPANGYLNNGVGGTNQIAIDDSNNVWVGNHSSPTEFSLADLSGVSGQLVINTEIIPTDDPTQPQMAADGAGSIWIPQATNPGSMCKMPAYGGLGTILLPTCYLGAPTFFFIYNPRGVAIDGAGAVWFGNSGGGSEIVPPNVTEFLPSELNNLQSASLVSSSLAAGPTMVAVDGSGNVWVLLGNNTITEYVGVATPAIEPIALAVKEAKLGKTP